METVRGLKNCVSECQEISFIIKGHLTFISVTVCMSMYLHMCVCVSVYLHMCVKCW